MREIKFRAWVYDKVSYYMTKPFYLYDITCDNAGNSIGGMNYIKDLEIMQFTGLHDKNGKEIYEGDIVKECVEGESIWQDFEHHKGVVKECPVGVVEWDRVGFNVRQIKEGLVDLTGGGQSSLHLSKYDGQFEWSLEGGDITVIGNIYKNPELLNEPKR